MSEYKLNIFDVLSHIDTKDTTYFSRLDDQQQKAVYPVVIQRWLTGINNPTQINIINELVNPYVFGLYKHPQLIWQLMTVSGSGKKQRYKWQSVTNKTSKPTSVMVVSEYFKYSSKHAQEALDVLSCEQVIELADHLGHPQEIVTKIKKEYNANGNRTKTSKQ